MPKTSVNYPLPLWIGYILLLIGLLAVNIPYTGLLPVAVLVFGYLLRHRLRKEGDQSAAAPHASWLITTVWLLPALAVGVAVVALALALFIVNDALLAGQIKIVTDSIYANKNPLSEGMLLLWHIPGLQPYMLVMAACGIVALIWPVQRLFQGMLALARSLPPHNLERPLRWLALAGAVIFQAAQLLMLL